MALINSLTDVKSVLLYLRRINAEERSLRTAVIRENHGDYWVDVAVIRITEHGEVSAPPEYMPTTEEQAAIIAECALVEWPKHKPLKRLTEVPPEIANADPKDVFEFRNEAGEIVMLQKRVYNAEKNQKKYLPFTYWTDGRWRQMEPEGPLPLFNIDKLKDASTVFIHEGAKAARHVQWMVEGKTKDARDALEACPWGDELKGAVHLGWTGGALNPYRTDWSSLKKAGITRAYIVPDNDEAGLSAVSKISKMLRFTTYSIQFTSEWKAGFDLADEWPKSMFKTTGGIKYYVGPSFRSCQHPATYATDEIQNKKGKPTIVLRENFKDLWAYVEEADLFVNKEMPEIVRQEAILNKMLAPFSDTTETSRLMVKAYRGRQTKLCYRPDMPGRILTNKGTASINLHIPTHIKPREGDPRPFLEFMDYLFPNPDERKEVLRWCATLIAAPEVRMEYGLLLVSEKQGIGKTTLGSAILGPLVGDSNVSFPGENDITNSEFNDWLANKRLAVVNEIYSGHSWKAYNRLKNYITDNEVTVNQKFQRKYTIENWCHILACSNSLRALRMEDDDRRWYYPEVNEHRWPRERFGELRSWLQSGGLSIILTWARSYGSYVAPGERAPMTKRKEELIEGSRTDAQREAFDLARKAMDESVPVALSMKDIEQYVKMAVKGRVFDSDYELRKVMKEAGMAVFDKRIVVSGRQQYVLLNQVLDRRLREVLEAEQHTEIVKSIKKAQDLLPVNM